MKPFPRSRCFTASGRPLWFSCGCAAATSGLDASGSSDGTRLAFKMRTLFDGEALVKDVAFDVGLGLQHHPQCTDRADKAATDHCILSNYATLELRVLAEHKCNAMYVPLNLAVEMKLTLGCHIAGDR